MDPVIFVQQTGASGLPLHDAWELAVADSGSIATPSDLQRHSLCWISAVVPGTVAAALPETDYPENSDDHDWWYRCVFNAEAKPEVKSFLSFDGLATIAEVWLNGELVLTSTNMFLAKSVEVSALLRATNELVICFRSLTGVLNERKPRPAWKTNFVTHQNMRWIRTTLLGRMSSWEPRLPPVGPWRGIQLISLNAPTLVSSDFSTVLDGDTGKITSRFGVHLCGDLPETISASLRVGESDFALQRETVDGQSSDIFYFSGVGEIESVPRWWPHTHGESELHACSLTIVSGGEECVFDLGRRGFKQVELNSSEEKLSFSVNGVEIFCRGACWTTNDIVSLVGSEEELWQSLSLARDAGINMLRVGGTMNYESDAFYRFCDELGIMVWQDFMFACMDYPLDDAIFHSSVTDEVRSQLARLSNHTSLTVYCGNTDVQLQAAMLGAPRESWSHRFFDHELETLCAEFHPGIPYFPATPCGGALPFHLDKGLAHYYGVGAFRRPLTDIASAGIKFASESMGFAHLPEPATIDLIFQGERPVFHDPRWKKAVPRDAGMAWDFEDIRDHYLQLLFHQDAMELRCYNPDRYLELSRVVSGEMQYRVFSQWRSPDNPCSGGLLWYFRDLVPGPGWGLIDSQNVPKAAYYAVRRAFLSHAVFLEERGLNGFYIHAINDTGSSRRVKIELKGYREGDVLTMEASEELELPPRSTQSLCADAMLDYFSDMGYVYQFGPVQHDVIHVRMLDADTGGYIDDDSYFPVTYSMMNNKQAEVAIEWLDGGEDGGVLRLTSKTFLQFVRLDLKSHTVHDNYFHLAPGCPREIKLGIRCVGKQQKAKAVKGYLEAINLLDPIRINCK